MSYAYELSVVLDTIQVMRYFYDRFLRAES